MVTRADLREIDHGREQELRQAWAEAQQEEA